MYIDWIQIENLRNLTNLKFEPAPGLNVLVGPNGSGKTSILEAVYLLARTRSFRTPRIQEVVQYQKESLLISAGIRKHNGSLVNTGIERGVDKTAIRFNNMEVKKSSIQARNLPLVLIAPDVSYLITGPPKQRRNWLDWAMFHVEPDYLEDWRSYHRALRQRNTALGHARPLTELAAWEQVMAETAAKISLQRQRFLEKIQGYLEDIGRDLLPFKTGIDINPGWPGEESLLRLLRTGREADRQAGRTRYGIQCSDVRFTADDRPLGAACSRGQIKLFLILLLIAQAQAGAAITGENPVYLIDDFRAEIDARSRDIILQLLERLGVQVFFTSTETEALNHHLGAVKLFHVEHGGFVKVIK
jgi:DNA replication and repair protein RecF